MGFAVGTLTRRFAELFGKKGRQGKKTSLTSDFDYLGRLPTIDEITCRNVGDGRQTADTMTTKTARTAPEAHRIRAMKLFPLLRIASLFSKITDPACTGHMLIEVHSKAGRP